MAEFFRRALHNTAPAKFESMRNPKTGTSTQNPDEIIDILRDTWQDVLTTKRGKCIIPDKWRQIIKNPKGKEQLTAKITIEELNNALLKYGKMQMRKLKISYYTS